jgi:tetratricopeptide (TPR) repeat protein
MSEDSDPTDIAQQIADQVEPDWTSISDNTGKLDALRLISDIATSFRGPEKEPDEPPVLFRWRHLDVREAVGAGAFGQVYRAYDPVLRREVALKLEHERPHEAGATEMIIAEARSMARLRHPNILAVHGADVEDGRVGIWSDLLSGSTLGELLETRERLTPAEVIQLAQPLATALSLIHRRGLVHGDIKPANIMIQGDGTPVLMDFGAAREQGRRHAVAMGSPRFMAPEQFRGGAVTPASDLFAFGVVLYRCLTGRYPWPADSLEHLERVHEGARRPSLGEVPWRFRPLLRELLAHTPARRPGAEALVERLERMRTARQRLLQRAAVGVVIVSLSAGLLTAINAYRAEQLARERTQLLRDVVTGSLAAADPEQTSGPTSIRIVYQNMAERMEDTLQEHPDALTEMRLMVGRGLGRLGEQEAGLEILERAVGELDPQAERYKRWLSQAWLAIAQLRTDMEDLPGAEQAVRTALAATEGRSDPDGPKQRLVARNRLVTLLSIQGRWVEQLSVQQALLIDRQALYGEDSLATAVDHNNLALTYQQLGSLDLALEHERRAAELLALSGDDASLRQGFVSLALASIQIDRDEFAEAQRHLDRARDLYVANLPEDHPSLIEVESEQARLWRRSGEHALAEPVLVRHLALDAPESSLYRHRAGRNLAYIRMTQQRWEEATTLLDQVNASLPPRYVPLRSYLLAARDYAQARDRREGFSAAAEAIEEALADLESRGLTRIEPHRNLRAWREDLRSAGGVAPL